MAGIVGGVVLLTQMGTLALAGAVGIILVGALWYRVYGRERTEREGAALDAIRRTTADYALDRTRELLATGGERRVLIPVGSATTAERERDLLRLAADMLPQRTPTPDGGDARERTDGSTRFGADTDVDTSMGSESEVDGDHDDRSDTDTDRAARSNPTSRADDDRDGHDGRGERDEREQYNGLREPRRASAGSPFRGGARTARAVERGPFDPLEVLAADVIAAAHGANVEFLATVDTSASADQREGLDTYLADLADLVRTGADYRVLDADERSRTDAFVDGARGADLAVVSTSAHSFVYNALFGSVPDRVIERLDCTALVAHSQKPRRHTFLRTVLDRFVH